MLDSTDCQVVTAKRVTSDLHLPRTNFNPDLRVHLVPMDSLERRERRVCPDSLEERVLQVCLVCPV
jgi:hypothetical protein